MENLDDALGKLLNDPNAMAQVMSVAQSLGAMLPQNTPEQDAPQESEPVRLPRNGGSRHTALFQALVPYLSPRRREKLERAMQIAQLSSLASLALHRTERDEADKGR